MTPKQDMRTPAGRAGLSQRIDERGQLVVVGKIVKVDDGGAYVRKATLEDLKRDAGGSR